MYENGEATSGRNEMADEKKDPKWVKWLAVVSTTVAIMFGLVKSWEVLSAHTPGPRFSVASACGPFALPEKYVIDYNMGNGTATGGKDAAAAGADVSDKDDEQEKLRSYVELSIKNGGDRVAEEVCLTCDFDGIYRTKTIDGSSKNGAFKRRFEIGNIGQEEVVSVSLWTPQDAVDTSSISLSHSVGIHKVKLVKVQRDWIVNLVVLVALGAMVGLGICVSREHWRLKRHILEVERILEEAKNKAAITSFLAEQFLPKLAHSKPTDTSKDANAGEKQMEPTEAKSTEEASKVEQK